jgi:hypothetical protein
LLTKSLLLGFVKNCWIEIGVNILIGCFSQAR